MAAIALKFNKISSYFILVIFGDSLSIKPILPLFAANQILSLAIGSMARILKLSENTCFIMTELNSFVLFKLQLISRNNIKIIE